MSRQDQKERKRIRDAMTAQGRKWVWLCEQTRYSRTHVSEMMTGRQALSPKFVKLAHNALGLRDEDESLVA